VVGGEEDAVAGGEGGAELVGMDDVDPGGAVVAAEEAGEVEVEGAGPEGAVVRGDGDVGFVGDDVHG
jgi:hypothetical protein